MNKPPITDVLEHYGAQHIPARHGWAKIRCPFHEDKNASATVNIDENLFKCFGCEIDSPLDNGKSKAYDSFDLIAWKEGCDGFTCAIDCAERLLGTRYGDISGGIEGQSRRRVFGESRPKRGQRSAFSSRIRRRTFSGT